jgi:hypothetical protein
MGKFSQSGIRTYNNSIPQYTFQNVTLNGVAAQSFSIAPSSAITGSNSLIQADTWSLAAFVGGSIRVNNMLYRSALTLTQPSAIAGWDVFRGEGTALTQQALALGLYIGKELTSDQLDRLFRLINTQTQNAIYTPYREYSTPILDGISPSDIEGVFALYNHVVGYTGNCVRLRRSSDNAELDFGFASSDYEAKVDVAAINTWAGVDNLFLVTWYNQSGGQNFITASNGVQPQFHTTGGGRNADLPYILPATSQMTMTTTLTSTSTQRIYCGFKGLSDGTLYRSGATTAAFSHRLISGVLSCNKRTGVTVTGIAINPANTSRVASLSSIITVTRTSTDTLCAWSGEIGTSFTAVNSEFSSAGNLTLFDGTTTDWANQTYFIIMLKTADNELDIEHRLIKFYQVDR